MLAGNLLLDLEGGVEVEVIEEVEGLADLGREVKRVGMRDRLGVERREVYCEEKGYSEEWGVEVPEFQGQTVFPPKQRRRGRRR
jgi:hypothetical protein